MRRFILSWQRLMVSTSCTQHQHSVQHTHIHTQGSLSNSNGLLGQTEFMRRATGNEVGGGYSDCTRFVLHRNTFPATHVPLRGSSPRHRAPGRCHVSSPAAAGTPPRWPVGSWCHGAPSPGCAYAPIVYTTVARGRNE